MSTFLVLPGLNGSGPDHWQTIWEQRHPDFQRVQFGDWSSPDRSSWVAHLDEAIASAAPPVVFVAHSLGCHAVAWWAATASAEQVARIASAMLVAPPDLDAPDLMAMLRSFAPSPRRPLPFPCILVASRDDPYATFDSSARLADAWQARLVDVGRSGHVNALSRLGDWPEGKVILATLIRRGA